MTEVTRTSTTTIAADAQAVWDELDANFLEISKWAGGVKSSVANPATPEGLNGSAHGGRVCEVAGVGTTDERIIGYAVEIVRRTRRWPGIAVGAGPRGGLEPAGNPITHTFPDRLETTRSPTGGEKFAYYLPESNTEVKGHNLTVTFDLSDSMQLKSITGYREFDDDVSQNFSQSFGGAGSLEVEPGVLLADRLPEVIYTPSTKASVGAHDENIDFAASEELLGADIAARVRDASLRLYTEAADYALERGIIIADTKFEFGLDDSGTLTLIDEVLTPDSSRFWPAEQYRPGTSPVSFDKQFVRDYLETLDWDKTAPGPELPADIVEKTAEKYRQAQSLLSQ